MEKTNVFHPPPSFVCPNGCGYILSIDHFFPAPFFEKKDAECPICRKKIDLWNYAVDILCKKSNIFRYEGAAFIGARPIYFTFNLPPNERVEICLEQYGVPDDANIIYLNCTPTVGAGLPVEMRSNELIPHKVSKIINFWGVPVGVPVVDGEKENDVHVLLAYIPKNRELISFENLATAYDLFLRDDYESMIIPCSTAIEYALRIFNGDALPKLHIFTKAKISNRVALEVIVPLISQVLSIPVLEKRILDITIELRKRRNEMAHSGFIVDGISTKEAARILAASMFIVNYLCFYNKKIIET